MSMAYRPLPDEPLKRVSCGDCRYLDPACWAGGHPHPSFCMFEILSCGFGRAVAPELDRNKHRNCQDFQRNLRLGERFLRMFRCRKGE